MFAEALRRARRILIHRGLNFVLLAVLGIILIGSAVELGFELHAPGSSIHDYGDALWWAMVTVTTVGYGDKVSVSAGGQGVAVVLMLVGIALIGVLTATIASFFVEEKSNEQMADLNARLNRIEELLTKAIARSDQPDDGTG